MSRSLNKVCYADSTASFPFLLLLFINILFIVRFFPVINFQYGVYMEYGPLYIQIYLLFPRVYPILVIYLFVYILNHEKNFLYFHFLSSEWKRVELPNLIFDLFNIENQIYAFLLYACEDIPKKKTSTPLILKMLIRS